MKTQLQPINLTVYCQYCRRALTNINDIKLETHKACLAEVKLMVNQYQIPLNKIIGDTTNYWTFYGAEFIRESGFSDMPELPIRYYLRLPFGFRCPVVPTTMCGKQITTVYTYDQQWMANSNPQMFCPKCNHNISPMGINQITPKNMLFIIYTRTIVFCRLVKLTISEFKALIYDLLPELDAQTYDTLNDIAHDKLNQAVPKWYDNYNITRFFRIAYRICFVEKRIYDLLSQKDKNFLCPYKGEVTKFCIVTSTRCQNCNCNECMDCLK